MQPRPPRPLTPAGRHVAFGYYDRCPWEADGRRHLALALPHCHGLPQPHERAGVCVIDHADGDALREIATTAAWNHQQGAMTHWLRAEPGRIVYNDREDDRVFARVIESDGRRVRDLPRPVYALSPDGRLAASIDFARIQRRGYSYAVANPALLGGDPLPVEDGLWVMDTATGAARLLASYRDMAALHPDPDELPGTFVWLNHPAFNRDGSRLFVLFRYFINRTASWKTYLFTVGVDGGGLRCVLPHVYWQSGGITHQEWGREPDEILVDAHFRQRGGGEFTVFRDDGRPPVFRVIAPGALAHGHQMFSPDGRWLVTDSYPQDGIQYLKLVRVADGLVVPLAAMRHPPQAPGEHDWRCDLHPRWRPDGRAISIDAWHDGQRRIWLIELDG